MVFLEWQQTIDKFITAQTSIVCLRSSRVLLPWLIQHQVVECERYFRSDHIRLDYMWEEGHYNIYQLDLSYCPEVLVYISEFRTATNSVLY